MCQSIQCLKVNWLLPQIFLYLSIINANYLMTNKHSEQTLKYSIVYRVVLVCLLISLLAVIFFLLMPIFGYPMWAFTGSKFIAILLTVPLYKLFNYTRYVFRWRAVLYPGGIDIFDPKSGKLSYSWGTDLVSMGDFNLNLLVIFRRGDKKRYYSYKISKWVSGQRLIVQSNIVYATNGKNEKLRISEQQRKEAMEETQQIFDDFLIKHKYNLLFLAYCFSLGTAGLACVYILIDIVYFEVCTAAVLCVAVALQITLVIQYRSLFTRKPLTRLVGAVFVSVTAFTFIMFDNVHAERELFFFRWGIVFGLVVTLFIIGFVLYHDIPIYLKYDWILCLGVFILFSLYSTSALKLANMFNTGKTLGWEQGTAHSASSLRIIIPGNDPDYIKFDNTVWGTRDMGLFFSDEINESVTDARVEIRVFEGRFGIPWFYKNYHKDQSDNIRLIK